MKPLCLFMGLALLLTACNTVQQAATPQPSSETPSVLLGVLRVDLSGLGSASPQVKGQFVPPQMGFSAQTFDYVNPTVLTPASGWVSFDDDDQNKVRYVKAVLFLKNTSALTLNNLSLQALSLSSGGGFDTLGGTGIANLRDAAGNAITDPSIARGMQPTHGITVGLGGAKVAQDLAQLQAYTPDETAQVQALYNTFGSGGAGKVLGYGYTASSNVGSRSIVSGSTAQVALAYRLPLNLPRTQNPWSLSLYFVVTTDTETSVTQSLEEQADNANVVTRANAISASKIRTLAGTTLLERRAGSVCGGAYALNTTTAAPEKWLSDPAPFLGSGKLDACVFGHGGKVTTPLGIGKAVALQSDGKIVVAGSGSTSGGSDDFALVRYTSSGALDTGFGTGGKVTTPIGLGNDFGRAVALQSDGKIVVAGSTSSISGNSDFAVVRYTSSGALDTSFGTGGKVTTPIGSSTDFGNAVALQSDGKIVVAGYSYIRCNTDFALLRYTSSGALDTSFGTGGKVTTPISSNGFGNAVALQSDGKIVVAGSTSSNGGIFDFALVRYTSSGALDTSFGTGGKVTTPIGSGTDFGRAVALQSDGKIVVAGSSTSGGKDDFALVRYTSSGALDSGFGTGGKVTTPFGSGNAVALQSDGKIVVAGSSNNGSLNDFAVARYQP